MTQLYAVYSKLLLKAVAAENHQDACIDALRLYAAENDGSVPPDDLGERIVVATQGVEWWSIRTADALNLAGFGRQAA